MATLMGKSCSGLVAQAFLAVVLQVCSLSPFQHEPFLRSTYLGQCIILDRGVFASVKMYFILSPALNSVIEFET
jgi:hypothetical protein